MLYLRCLDVYTLAHELGHSLALNHSSDFIDATPEPIVGYDQKEYGDETCMMGHAFIKNSYLENEKKIEWGGALPVCFYGAKSWQLGWFEEQYRHTFSEDNNKWEGN